MTPPGDAPPSTEDAALVTLCRDGDPGAWDALYERYERLVFSIPLNMGLSRDDAADVLQTTFTLLIERLHTLNRPGSVGGWLATVARRESWQLIERRKRGSETSDEEFGADAYQATASNHVEAIDRLTWIDYGLRCLDPKCRELLVRLYFAPEEPGYAEVAQELGMAIGSIGPTRARCLERLRQILDREAPERSQLPRKDGRR